MVAGIRRHLLGLLSDACRMDTPSSDEGGAENARHGDRKLPPPPGPASSADAAAARRVDEVAVEVPQIIGGA